MKYVTTAVVRHEGVVDGETWTEIFAGDLKEWQEPARLAFSGVSDINARLRLEDRKIEIVSVSWFKASDIPSFISTIIQRYVDVTDDKKSLLALEDALDKACMDLYSLTHTTVTEEGWTSTYIENLAPVGLQPSEPWPDDDEFELSPGIVEED